MRMFARLLVAVVAFGATLLPGGTARAADSVVETINVWQWNVSGWKMNGGSTTTGMVEAAAASIVNRKADRRAVLSRAGPAAHARARAGPGAGTSLHPDHDRAGRRPRPPRPGAAGLHRTPAKRSEEPIQQHTRRKRADTHQKVIAV
ncbi:hypothetical protein [Nonomuraea sp. JJY05]|uniref:hypothetical protein n=1 Tax=Nonomuraea sp. JJY05 TaxID=3350255 RepID=UPI00373F2B36